MVCIHCSYETSCLVFSTVILFVFVMEMNDFNMGWLISGTCHRSVLSQNTKQLAAVLNSLLSS